MKPPEVRRVNVSAQDDTEARTRLHAYKRTERAPPGAKDAPLVGQPLRRASATSATVVQSKPFAAANRATCAPLAMLPSAFISSHSTPAGTSPASIGRS